MLTPNLVKHHIRARIREEVRVKTNPITEEDFARPRRYRKVEIDWPTPADPNPKTYIYLVPIARVADDIKDEVSEEAVENFLDENTELSEDEIEDLELTDDDVEAIWEVVQEYNRNRLEYARDWREYLADTEPEALDSPPEALL